MIYFNTASRAACVSIINYIADESEWLAIPHDIDGNLLAIFVQKICSKGTGYRAAADLFDRDGYASETAANIARIAFHQGGSVLDAAATGCASLIGAVREIDFHDDGGSD